VIESEHTTETVAVLKNILEKNNHEAQHIRTHFDRKNIFALNLMGSPGSGKTALLETLAERFRGRLQVIEGDLETDRDAVRLQKAGIPSHQITTGQACHLDASMVHEALHHIEPEENSLLAIENVGNLVCPAVYDIGAHLNVVLLSVTEGDDKVAKYPVMFRTADLLIVTKTDLLAHVPFELERVKSDFRRLNRRADLFSLSATTGENVEPFLDYLELKLKLRG